MSATAQEIEQLISQEYKQGFVTELEVDTFPPGLDEDVIRRLSKVEAARDKWSVICAINERKLKSQMQKLIAGYAISTRVTPSQPGK